MIIAAVAGSVLAIAVFLIWWMNRVPRVDRNESGMLPLFGSMSEAASSESGDVGVMAGGTVRQQPRIATPPTPVVAVGLAEAPPPAVAPVAQAALPSIVPPPAAPPVVRRPDLRLEANPAIRTFTTAKAVGAPRPEPENPLFAPSSSPLTAAHLPVSAPVSGHGVPGTMVEGHLVRFSVPQEGTLQFLPGRLEIGAGLDSGREIRFVHVPGPNGMEVTFGRSEGELYRHIQLRDQTVSRSHARMRLVDGHWYLLNLSQTNPIVHNGIVVSNSNEHLLSDGDRIEMGEVLFTFRSR
ncbi:MAG: FHA domain-containing protein [Gemmatimonadaceae bacterium]|nr:FHA domain-containing protein [Gemmatimonadaceae bacterium]